MITLIHGDDISASRNYYLSEKEKVTDKKIVDGSTITLVDFMQIFSGNGLFGDSETVFIDELVSKRKSPKDIEELVGILSDQEASIFIWESKTLTPKQIGLFKKAVVKEFKIPTIVFIFLDSIRPNNSAMMLKLYHELLEYEDAVYVLVMLIRQVRILLALQAHTANGLQTTANSGNTVNRSLSVISEVSRMSSWQKGKMEKQTKLFTTEELLSLHQQLYELEYAQKTGGLSFSLSSAIDFFLASI